MPVTHTRCCHLMRIAHLLHMHDLMHTHNLLHIAYADTSFHLVCMQVVHAGFGAHSTYE